MVAIFYMMLLQNMSRLLTSAFCLTYVSTISAWFYSSAWLWPHFPISIRVTIHCSSYPNCLGKNPFHTILIFSAASVALIRLCSRLFYHAWVLLLIIARTMCLLYLCGITYTYVKKGTLQQLTATESRPRQLSVIIYYFWVIPEWSLIVTQPCLFCVLYVCSIIIHSCEWHCCDQGINLIH